MEPPLEGDFQGDLWWYDWWKANGHAQLKVGIVADDLHRNSVRPKSGSPQGSDTGRFRSLRMFGLGRSFLTYYVAKES